MVRKKFLRSGWRNYSKLGKGRKKKQVYRKPKGRDNKMREKRRNRPKIVDVGYKKKKIKKAIKKISNLKQLDNVKKGEKIFISSIGNKKKLEIVKKAKQEGIKIINLNIDKFIKKIEGQIKKRKQYRKQRKQEKKEKTEEKKTKKKEAKETKEVSGKTNEGDKK